MALVITSYLDIRWFLQTFILNWTITKWRRLAIVILVTIHESEISIKLLELQSKWTPTTKIEQELLNMCQDDVFWSANFSASSATSFMLQKIAGRGITGWYQRYSTSRPARFNLTAQNGV